MKTLIIIALVAVCFAISPPMWGGNPVYTVRVEMLNNAPVAKWNFTYYYNSNLKVERYEHEGPQTDEACYLAEGRFNKNNSCAITFATDGWMYIEYPKDNFCCKCTNSFGYIKPDWLQENSTYNGTTTINGVTVDHWTKPGQYLNHYYDTVDKNLPVRFFEIKNGNPKSWDFDLKTYTTAPIDPSKFSPKCQNLCLGTCRFIKGDQAQVNLKT